MMCDPGSMLIGYKAEQLQIGELENRLLADGWRRRWEMCTMERETELELEPKLKLEAEDGSSAPEHRPSRTGKHINLVDVAASSLSSQVEGYGSRALGYGPLGPGV